jgi:hypothetical protein
VIRAAIVPYAGGFCGVVVASGDVAPLALLAAESIEVGRLVPLDPPVKGRDMRRDVSPADVAALAARVVGRLREHGAEHVTIEQPTAKARIACTVADALASAAAAAGIPVAHVDTTWRKQLEGKTIVAESTTGAGKTLLARIAGAERIARSAFATWPSPSYEPIELAGALLVRDLLSEQPEAEQPEVVAADETEPAAASPAPVDVAPSETAPPASVETEPAEPAEQPEASALAPVDLEHGPTVCGIDPGSRAIGLAIVDPATGALVHRATFTIGREVALPKPRIVKRADGSEHTRTHTRVIAAEDVAGLVSEVIVTVRKHDVRRVVLEWIEHARISGTAALAASQATNIARAQWVGGALHGALLALDDPPVEVRLVTARTWTARATGAKNTKGRRGAIAPVVEARFPELVGADEHERDAAGLLVWDAMPPKKPRAARVRTSKGADGATVTRGTTHAARRERNEAKRVAAGCSCTSRRHRRGCPLFKPLQYGRRKHHASEAQ